jgi:prepilin-type processing-associated H-X9-DG protein
MGQISDGAANTILVVEAKREIPWTKPEDIPYAADQPLPALGGWTENHFNALYADGHVVTESLDQHESILRAKITRRGREIIEDGAATPATDPGNPRPVTR